MSVTCTAADAAMVWRLCVELSDGNERGADVVPQVAAAAGVPAAFVWEVVADRIDDAPWLAALQGMPVELVVRLCSHPSPAVVAWTFAQPGLNAEIVESVAVRATDGDLAGSTLYPAVLSHPAVAPRRLVAGARSSSVWDRAAVASNPLTADDHVELLELLAVDAEPAVREAVASNTRCPVWLLERIVAASLAGSHPRTRYWERFLVVGNPQVTVELLELLADDPVNMVVAAARRRLAELRAAC